MGIKDLLKNLEGATVQKNIGDFAGKRLAVDASGWLHKAVFATAEDWVDSNCTDSQLYVDFVLTRVKNVQQCRVTPVMVFDGKRNNLKSETRAKRDEGRLSNIEHAKRLIENIRQTSDVQTRGKMRNECIACFQRGLGVTHEMEKNCMAALRKAGVEVIVAPYEADPQLAYLCHIGYCDGVMTEDSDILVYSAVCGTPFPILYKFEKNGSVQITDLSLCGVFASSELKKESNMHKEVSSTDLEGLCSGIGVADSTASTASSTSKKRKFSATRDPLAPVKMGSGADGFLNQLQMYFKPPARSIEVVSDGAEAEGSEPANYVGRRMFVQLCLLAGCDYSDSIPGVGLMTAIQAVIRFKEVPNNLRLKKICDYFKLTGKRVADTYLPRLLRAEQLFYYHPVFNPYSDSIAHFTEPKVSEGNESGMCANGPNNNSGSSNDNNSAGPCINELELYRLGADTAEILALSRPSPSGSPTNTSATKNTTMHTAIDADTTLTIRAACRGLASIKDGTEIVPRYPWEGPHPPHQKGSSSGWYMRKSLIATLGNSSSNSSSSTGFNTSTKAASYFKSHTTTASVSYSSSDNKRGSTNSFALANISSARSSSSSLFSMSKFALKTGPVEGQPKSTVLPYQLQQQLSQRPTNPTSVPMSSKNAYFDSIQLTTAINNSLHDAAITKGENGAAVKITSHHFQRTTTQSTHTTHTSSNKDTQFGPHEVYEVSEGQDHGLSTYTDETDQAMIYDLCEDSPPAKKQRTSPLRYNNNGSKNSSNNGNYSEKSEPVATSEPVTSHSAVMRSPVQVSVYDVLDSPIPSAVSVNKTKSVNNIGNNSGNYSGNNSGNNSVMALDLSSEGPGSPQLSFTEYLHSYKCSEATSTTVGLGSPSKLQMLLSPATNNSTGGTTKHVIAEPNATTKKGKNHTSTEEQDISHDRLQQVPNLHEEALVPGRRKTLGAAPFVPIAINNTLSSTMHTNNSAEKRKAYTAVPIARKKATKSSNSASTGTIMVASIKSFFNAV